MKVKELLTEWEHESRSEYDWNREMSDKRANQPSEQLYNLVDRLGRIIRPGLTQRAAVALSQRPDLVKKYGKLFAARG